MLTVSRKLTESLHRDPTNPRKDFPLEELRLLGESLRKKQLVPLLVRKSGMIVDGERRCRAAMLVGLAELDVILLEDSVTPGEVKEIQLVTSLQRAALTPYETFLGFLDWLREHPGKGGKDLAAAIHRSEASVSMTLSLSRCTKLVQDAAASGQIGLKDWHTISQAAEAEQEAMLMALLRGASTDEVKRMRKKSDQPAVRLPKIKIPLANDAATGVVTVTGEGIDLDDTETLLKEALKAVRSAKDKNLDSKTAQSVWRDMANA